MKNLVYLLSGSRSFARLFSLLVCLAIGSLFMQQAVADELGWGPDGGWDPINFDSVLSCHPIEGTTTLTRTPPAGPDSLLQDGKVSCTWIDTQETADCLLNVLFSDLVEDCVDNIATSTLTVAGECPHKEGNQTVGAGGAGTIDCRGRDTNGNLTGSNPNFCSFNNTTTNDCVLNVGFSVQNPLTLNQCNNFAGDPPVVVSLTRTYAGLGCGLNAKNVGVGDTISLYFTSDSWDSSNPVNPSFQGGSAQHTVDSRVESVITADVEYQTTISPICNDQNSGKVSFTVLGNNKDPGTNPVSVQNIDQDKITVNGFPVVPGSCNFPNPNTLQCQVFKCVNQVNICTNHISGKTCTLDFVAAMIDGTPVVGDPEIRNVSSK